MKINNIFLRNFRAVGADGLDIDLRNNRTTILGENNVGKSSIFAAIKKVLASSDASWEVEEWHGADQQQTIEIYLECALDEEQITRIINFLALPVSVSQYVDSFSDLLLCKLSRTIYQTSLLFKIGRLSIEGSDAWVGDIDRKSGYATLGFRDVVDKIKTINSDQKIIDIIEEQVNLVTVASSSSYAKMQFNTDVNKMFVDMLNKGLIVVEEYRERPENTLNEFLVSSTGRELASVLFNLKNGRNLTRYFTQIKSRFHQLYPDLEFDVIREGEKINILIQKSHIESTTLYVGAGVIQVLLLLTHSTSYSKQVLFMDCPESHLHPHVLRRMASIMESTGDGQIIVITHSPYLVGLSKNSMIYRAVQLAAQTRLIGLPKKYFSDDDYLKLEQLLDIDCKELLFAKKVLLVEGPTELGALPILADKLGYNFDENGVSVVNVGGKWLFPLFAKICEGFQIPYFILADNDARSIADKLIDSYRNCKYHVLAGDFEDTLPNDLLAEAEKALGKNSKPRIGRFVANKMKKEEISEEIKTIIEQIKDSCQN